MSKKDYIDIYTDGSCLSNPGKGSYAALIEKGDFVRLKYKDKDVRGHVIDERHDVYRVRVINFEYEEE